MSPQLWREILCQASSDYGHRQIQPKAVQRAREKSATEYCASREQEWLKGVSIGTGLEEGLNGVSIGTGLEEGLKGARSEPALKKG